MIVRRKLERIGRGALAMAAVAGIALLGWKYGPKTPEAHATVFEKLGAMWMEIPAFKGADGRNSPPRDVTFNGAKLRYTVGHYQADYKRVLDFYEGLYKVDSGWLIPAEDLEKLGMQDDPKSREAAKALRDLDARMSRDFGRVRRTEGSGGGIIVILDPGKNIRERPMAGWAVSMEEYKRTGKLGALGTVKVIFVMAQGLEKSLVFSVWADKELSLETMVPKGGGDAPGEDLADAPRYPGSRRVADFSEKGEGWRSQMLMYESRDDMTSHALYFESTLKTLGWEPMLQPGGASHNGRLEEGRTQTLIFNKEGRELTVIISEKPGTAVVSSAILARREG